MFTAILKPPPTSPKTFSAGTGVFSKFTSKKKLQIENKKFNVPIVISMENPQQNKQPYQDIFMTNHSGQTERDTIKSMPTFQKFIILM
jgi:hypothetical protein